MSAERVAVIGAGLMGHGLAQVFAEAGHPVAIHDPQAEALNSTHARIATNLKLLGRDGSAVTRVSLHPILADAVVDAGYVFEAAPEKLEIKRAIFARLEALAPSEAILSTNTSVMPIGQIAGGIASADRVVGTHWWNPPYLVPIVEVVQAERTSDDCVERMMSLLRGVGKDPVHVKRDVPGFVGNRLQHAMWREAFALIADDVCDAETIDRVVKGSFGPRLSVMGPIETADYVGLDLTLDIHEQILPDLDRRPGPSPYLRDLVARGDLGMKTGRGFRSWTPNDRDRLRTALIRHLSTDPEAAL